MTGSNQIKLAMKRKNITIKRLSTIIGVSPQVLSNKLYRDTMSYSEVSRILELIGMSLELKEL